MYAAEYVWLATLNGDESPLTPVDMPGSLPGNQEGENAAQSLDELLSRWSELDAQWHDYHSYWPEMRAQADEIDTLIKQFNQLVSG